MNYSLINVDERHEDGTVSGSLVQHKTGTLEGAIDWAIGTELVNSNKLDIAVVEIVSYGYVDPLSRWTNLNRLDTQRNLLK